MKLNYFTILAKVALIVIIYLIINTLNASSQSLTLKNSSMQLVEEPGSKRMYRKYFLMFVVNGNPKVIKTDSLCVPFNCVSFATPDSSSFTIDQVRGRKKTFLTINYTDKLMGISNHQETPIEENGKSKGILYYHSGTKAKKVEIPRFNFLPTKVEHL